MEKRQRFVRKVAELAKAFFIDDATNLPRVRGLVLAGSSALKQNVADDATFDPRLRGIVLCALDVCYGGDNGFSQAIELAASHLKHVECVYARGRASPVFLF